MPRRVNGAGRCPRCRVLYAVGRDIAELRARLLQEVRTEDEHAEVEVHITW